MYTVGEKMVDDFGCRTRNDNQGGERVEIDSWEWDRGSKWVLRRFYIELKAEINGKTMKGPSPLIGIYWKYQNIWETH